MKWGILIAGLALLLPATAAGAAPEGYGPITTTLWQWETTWYPDGNSYWSNATTGDSYWADQQLVGREIGLVMPDQGIIGYCLHPSSYGRWKYAVTTNADCSVAYDVVGAAVRGRNRVAGWKCSRPSSKQVSCSKKGLKIRAKKAFAKELVEGFDPAVAYCGVFRGYQQNITVYAKDEQACDSGDDIGWKIAANATSERDYTKRAVEGCITTATDRAYHYSCKTDHGCLVFVQFGPARFDAIFVTVAGMYSRMLVEPQGGIPACE